jgi:hypothetical protein
MDAHDRRRALLALLLTVPAPTIGSLCAYALVPGPIGQSIYMVLRVWLGVAPLLWLFLVERRRPSFSPLAPRLRVEAWSVAAALSIVFTAAILGAFGLVGRTWLDAEHLREAVARFGLDSKANYLAFGAFIAFGNSLLEEYVWRWFVYRRVETLTGPRAAVLVSAACFTLHHVATFTLEFGAAAGLLASAGVFAAGCIWSWCYLRYRSVWPGWATHVVADVVGLAIGWQILFG